MTINRGKIIKQSCRTEQSSLTTARHLTTQIVSPYLNFMQVDAQWFENTRDYPRTPEYHPIYYLQHNFETLLGKSVVSLVYKTAYRVDAAALRYTLCVNPKCCIIALDEPPVAS